MEFETKYLGEAKKILGMEVGHDMKVRNLWLSQRKYVEKVLQRFGMDNAQAVLVPLTQHFKLSATMSPTTDSGMVEMLNFFYTQVVGCLIYFMICTRSDIVNAVIVVSNYMANPVKEYRNVVT